MKKFFIRTIVYLVTLAFSGAFSGIIYTSIIFLLTFWIPTAYKGVFLIILLSLYALHEIGIIRLKIPQRHWQIPDSWVNQKGPVSMVVWGLILGPGIFTYIPHFTFYVIYLYLGMLMEPAWGLLFGGLFGISRAIPSIMISLYRGLRASGKTLEVNNLFLHKRINSILNAIILTLFGIYIFYKYLS